MLVSRVTPFGFNCLAASLFSVCFLSNSNAQTNTVRAVDGGVTLQRGDKSMPAKVGMRLRQGDKIISPVGAEVLLRFNDGARLAVRSDSEIQLKALQTTGPGTAQKKTIRLLVGALRFVSGIATVSRNVSFETRTATIGIRGTDIEISVSEVEVLDNNPGTYLKVNSGAAQITAPDGAAVEVAPGEVAYGGEPELQTRGAGGTRRSSARKLQAVGGSLFAPASMDALMR